MERETGEKEKRRKKSRKKMRMGNRGKVDFDE